MVIILYLNEKMYYTNACMKINKKDKDIVSKSLKDVSNFMKKLSDSQKKPKKVSSLVK